jgi:putative phosphoesterase
MKNGRGTDPCDGNEGTNGIDEPNRTDEPNGLGRVADSMLVAVSDSHATEGHALRGRTLTAVREADRVIHAGDFCREAVLDAFLAENDAVYGVTGNNDDAPLRARLPESRVVSYAGVSFAVRHRSRSGATGLALLARELDADAVIFGHSHRPTVEESGPLPLVNPGSHAQPRGNRPAHAEFEPLDDGDGVLGRLVTPDGERFDSVTIRPDAGDPSR